MGVYILNHNLPVAHFWHIRMWTERGIIYIEDKQTGQCKSMSVAECVQRIKAVNDMIRETLSMDDWQLYYEELHAMQSFVEKAIEVMRKAQEFGDPFAEQRRKSKLWREYYESRPIKLEVIEGFRARTPDDVANMGTKREEGEVVSKPLQDDASDNLKELKSS